MARNQAGKRGGIWLKTLIFGVLAIGGIGAGAVILQPMLGAPSSDVALIKAEPGPFREKPMDPGGTKIPHTDSTVMSMLGGVIETDEDVEILLPPADVPEMPPLPKAGDETIVMAPAPAPVSSEKTDGAEAGEGTSTEMAAAGDAGAKAKMKETDIASNASTGAAETVPATTDAAPDNAPDSAPDSAQDNDPDTDAAPAASLQSVPQPKPDVPAVRKGPSVEGDEPLYLVQLAAFRNADTAREQAAMLGGKHVTRLGGVELGTMKVDAGENGIFWRVITEPLERNDADSLCSALKRAGQDCILRKFDKPSSS